MPDLTTYDGARLCGVDDTLGVGQLCKWPLVRVTWSVVADLPGFARETFRAAAEEAWSYWSAVCGILPQQIQGPAANVVIGIQSLGPGGVLADCQLPCGATIGSTVRMRVDTEEAWVLAENPPPTKIDLVRVLAHELGHAIGIPHIGSGNLMAPTYSSAIRRPVAGDVAEAVARYGLVPPRPPEPPTPGPLKELQAWLLDESTGRVYVRVNGVMYGQ